MANTYVALAKTVLTGTSSSIVFDSIVGTYTDLVLLCSIRENDGGGGRDAFRVFFNTDTTSSTTGSNTQLFGYSSAAYTGRTANSYFSNTYDAVGSAATSNTFSSVELYIPNYAASTNKAFSVTGVSENNSATIALTGTNAMLWSNTAVITKITITPTAGITNFASGSSFYLYGIKNS